MGVQFVQHMAIDVDEIAAVGALRDAMKIPYFGEQRLLHDCGAHAGRHILVAQALLSKRGPGGDFMPSIVGIDHLVLSVGDFTRSKTFYNKLLSFLGFKLKHEYDDMAGWSNGKTLFWIAAADAEGRKHKYRKGDIGFHHYAFEMASRKDVDALGAFLEGNGVNIVDPPGEYYGRDYYAVYFTDPDGMKLEAMIWAPPKKSKRKRS
jgi:catechol 2,3-dioxygenase-like lactoylglutathione lyase family enzyme